MFKTKSTFITGFWILFLIITSIFLSATNQIGIRTSRLLIAQMFIFTLFIFEMTGCLPHRTSYRNKWLMFFLIWIFFGIYIKNLVMHGYFNVIFYDTITYFALINIILFTYLCITTIRCMSGENVEKILKTMCWLLVFQCAYSLIQLVQYDSVFYDVFMLKEGIFANRMVGTLENENMLGAYLSFIIPLCFIWRKKGWNIIGVIAVIFVLLTKSIMAIASAGAGLGMLLFLRSKSIEVIIPLFKGKKFFIYIKKSFALCLMLLTLLTFGLYKFNIITYQKNILNIAVKTKQIYHFDFNNCGRFQHWKESLLMAKTNSFTGIGIGKYKIEMPKFMKNQTCRTYGEAHNDFLQVLCETGIVGFGLFAIFLFHILRKAWRLRQNLLMQGILCGLSAFMVNAVGNFPVHIVHLAGIGLFFLCSIEILYKESEYV